MQCSSDSQPFSPPVHIWFQVYLHLQRPRADCSHSDSPWAAVVAAFWLHVLMIWLLDFPPGLQGLVSGLCGSSFYNPISQLCCDGTVVNKTTQLSECCGKRECHLTLPVWHLGFRFILIWSTSIPNFNIKTSNFTFLYFVTTQFNWMPLCFITIWSKLKLNLYTWLPHRKLAGFFFFNLLLFSLSCIFKKSLQRTLKQCGRTWRIIEVDGIGAWNEGGASCGIRKDKLNNLIGGVING